MRTMTAITLSVSLILAACSRDVSTVAAPAVVTLPADVKDLAKEPAGHGALNSPVEVPTGATTVAAPQEEALAATGELVSPMRSQVAPKMPGRVAAVFVREGQ